MIKMNNKGRLALAQITLLVFGIIAIGYALGSEVRNVSGAADTTKVVTSTTNTMSYKIIKDDTLTKIARDYNTDVKTLLKLNPSIKDPDIIYAGKSINVPKTVSPPSGAPGPVDVKKGLVEVKDSEKILNQPGDLKLSEDYCKNNRLSVGCNPEDTDDKGSTNLEEKNTDKNIPANAKTINHAGALSVLGGQLMKGLEWSMYVVGAIQIVGRIVGMEDNLVNSLSGAAFGGIMAGQATYGLFKEGGYFYSETGNKMWSAATVNGEGGGFWSNLLADGKGITNTQVTSVGVGIVVAAIILYMTYKSEDTETISFTCEQWQAPVGGNMCEQCNKQSILPCSEYQCRSLGQSCEIINKGTAEEKCAWINRNDVTPPIISLWKDSLSKNHRYTPDTSVSPPDVGTKIVYEQSKDGCIKAFTPLEFGIITDEPASCKLDYVRKDSFANMSYYLGGTPAFLYNHTQIMSLPGSSNLAAENITIQNNGEYSLFIRCLDSNGNENVATWVFRFCVEKGPDTTPPMIVATNLLNGMPVSFNQSSINFETYTNEPATCKWGHLDQSYEDMENKMTCSSSVIEMNAQMVYKCKTTLNGIKDNIDNNFYIRCEDNPSASESDRNRNTESYKFSLIGTKPLIINEVSPNETIKDSTDVVKVTLGVKTSAGYQEGNSTCYYSPTETTEDYVMFFNTNSYLHSQELYLPSGEYTYYIKCVDLGGNVDTNKTIFKVETDTFSPIIVRAYNEESNLKIITDESAMCVYGFNDCLYNIEDGLEMSSIDVNQTQHYVSWDTGKTFYIKCMDKYENQPYPNQCSMILRPQEKIEIEED
jgi:LysM repeat protein